jgi:hypothetical protein
VGILNYKKWVQQIKLMAKDMIVGFRMDKNHASLAKPLAAQRLPGKAREVPQPQPTKLVPIFRNRCISILTRCGDNYFLMMKNYLHTDKHQ